MQKLVKKIQRKFCKEVSSEKFFLSGEQLKEQLKKQEKLEIINQSIFFDEQYFKEKGELFNIKNKDLDRKNIANVITAYSDDFIFVNDQAYSTSLVIFESMVLQWDINSFRFHSPNSFKILELIHPKPEYILIGTELDQKKINNQTIEYIESVVPNVKVDCLDFFTTISTFNSCMTDNIKAVAFLCLHQLIVQNYLRNLIINEL